MADPKHMEWLREGVNSWNTRRQQQESFPNSIFFRPNFIGANLTSGLEESACKTKEGRFSTKLLVLDGIDLRGGLFQNAQLRHFSLRDANLAQAQFEKAELWNSDLRSAKLDGANLTDAYLNNVDLRGAKLTYADLTRAQLARAKLDGADLRKAILSGADFTNTQPWTSILFPDPQGPVAAPFDSLEEVREIGDLAIVRQSLEDHYKNNLKGTYFNDDYVFYFRGEGNNSWKLSPYIMRKGKAVLRNKEGEMLLDLMSRRPEDFIGATSALSQWVIAQHHGLKTRLLDITRNPLVALFHACEHPSDSSGKILFCNGILHVFVVPKSIVKTFDSDAVSVVTNLAKLPRSEQDRLMGKLVRLGETPSIEELILDRTNKYFHIMDRLYHYIRQEKPHFKERIDIRDFFRVFVVEPQQSFERIRVQSGAFLISGFHGRFETDEILKSNKNTPVYHHYRMTVPADSKDKILDELKFLNITREVLFPGLDEAAKAIVKRYEGLNS